MDKPIDEILAGHGVRFGELTLISCSGRSVQGKTWFTRNMVKEHMQRQNTTPTRYAVGDKVKLTQRQVETMRSHNRSSVHAGYPSDNFIAGLAKFVDQPGEVTNIHLPGYEVTVRFGDRYFHVKDNWVERV